MKTLAIPLSLLIIGSSFGEATVSKESTIQIDGKSAVVTTTFSEDKIILRRWQPDTSSSDPIRYVQWSIIYDGQIVFTSIQNGLVLTQRLDTTSTSEPPDIYILQARFPAKSDDSYIFLYSGLISKLESVKEVYRLTQEGQITVLDGSDAQTIHNALLEAYKNDS